MRFRQLSPDVGEHLISPLYGRCFTELIDIWQYQFCVGDFVDQTNTQDQKEIYVIGKLPKIENERVLTKEPWSNPLPTIYKQRSKILKQLRQFSKPPVSSSKHDLFEFMTKEFLEIDEGGRVIRTVFIPQTSTNFPLEEFRTLRSSFEKQIKYG